MNTSKRIAVVLGVGAVLSLAQAGSAQWSGSGNNFSYSNGADLNGLFGEPFVGGANMDTLIFDDFQFSVQADSGGQQVKQDTVTFDVTVPAGFTINRIQTVVTGDVLAFGDGTFVDLTSGITVTELNGLQRVLTSEPGVCDFDACDLIGNPVPFPRFAPDQGQFSGLAEVDMTGLFVQPSTQLRISLSLESIADAGLDGLAVLNTNLASQQLEIKFIPEPASLALVALGFGLVGLRRRCR
jgi:hypothetical protein